MPDLPVLPDSRLERLTSDQLDPAADDWTTDVPVPAVTEQFTPSETLAARRGFGAALTAAERAAERLLRHSLPVFASWTGTGSVLPFVQAADRLQDLRRRLGEFEALLVRAAAYTARDHNAEREGLFPDGRRWEVKRAQDRKAWDHDAWKADVRRQVLSGVPAQLIDPATGETVDVRELLVGVQEAHGSTAPRVGQLKRLGLDAGDYCEQVPGAWQLKVSAPESSGE